MKEATKAIVREKSKIEIEISLVYSKNNLTPLVGSAVRDSRIESKGIWIRAEWARAAQAFCPCIDPAYKFI